MQEAVLESWSSKIAKSIIDVGKPVFQDLEKGLRSKTKRVSGDSLTAIAWIGCEISKCPNSQRYSACEILLSGTEQFLHPGLELEERLLADAETNPFSEGVREYLRRFSGVTWMADELHRVADDYLPNQSRISCVHTQIVEANGSNSGAITALIYCRGLLYSGHSDGSIKVWQMVQRKMECIEVIAMEEPIRQLETYGPLIFVITQGYRMKVYDSSRTSKNICKTKKVKCMNLVQGKIYIGCKDSSIQELTIATKREREIKAPTKSWMMQNKPINSIGVYKDWLYSASSVIEGSKVKEWRMHHKPQISTVADKGRNVLAMEVVEDFTYFNCSSSTSNLQIWLKGMQQKVGRMSVGSRIISLLIANDVVLCGTEKGLIKVCSINSSYGLQFSSSTQSMVVLTATFFDGHAGLDTTLVTNQYYDSASAMELPIDVVYMVLM
ncbi:unnamed protein product [Dovyalis caffra]|uniref:Putative E3 ubiquitin-protein ligase LIN ARM-like domain-containing protein n=1 Tax=Dovyalis caffra TaxID=77055 RepID=A0AAV1QN20_9ROSI|nr:unnamed protein product [Dovyalis caffra]